jgi:Flp pilus assembly protein TadD
LAPGKRYTLKITAGETVREAPFRVFSKAEAREYGQLAQIISEQEEDDPRTLYSRLIYLQSELGLLNLAEQTAQKAVKEFPKDAGFYIALAQIQQKLEMNEQAKLSLQKATKLEQ